MKDKITERISYQFTFNLLRLTKSQEIKNLKVLKVHKWKRGDVYELGKVS